MILYVNNQHCTSVNQLKDYFSDNLTPDSDIYADLLDYGRHGDISEWLREMGEPELASKVETIAPDLSDSAFYAQLKATITGSDMTESDAESFKYPFDKCFSFEGVKCDVKDTEAKVKVILKVLLCVNEEYELRVSSDWGVRAMMVNPYNHPEGKSAGFEYTFYKRPGKNIGEITVLADGKELSRSAKFSRGGDEITVGSVSFKMIYVEGGSFEMGEKYGVSYEAKPIHSVTLDDYYISETQVTQALWKAVMGDNPSLWKGDSLPVEHIFWYTCQQFVEQLNQKTGRNFRLPTEAEWEYAARGGRKSQGFMYAGSDDISEVAWYKGNSGGKTHPVRQKKPNELGLYDMSGNVWELCQDWYGSYNSSPQTNPTGPASGSDHVVRGGRWDNDSRYCRLSCRRSDSRDYTSCGIGFRLVLSE